MERIKVDNITKNFFFFKRDLKKLIWAFTGKAYDKKFEILKGVSFTISDREIVGIIGKNGAGKSTVLKLIAEIYYPNSGNISVNGSIASLIELSAGFEPDLTGRENIMLKGQLMGFTRDFLISVMSDIIKFAEIGDYIDLPLKTYSSGMKARLGFALSAKTNPDILIIDEVFAVGDKNFQEKSKKMTMKFFEEGKTILFVSHSENQVKDLCERVIYLKDGHIAFDGNPDEAFEMYNKDNGVSK
ncbi:MAG: ABC transporter ATP-binding protein [Bacilli bacterium]